jgi:hypothetical protein
VLKILYINAIHTERIVNRINVPFPHILGYTDTSRTELTASLCNLFLG